MPRLVKLDDVWEMLDNCLSGYTRTPKTHRWNVKHKGRIYHEVPLGKHGARKNPEIETGHIRGLVTFFGIKKNCYEQYVSIH
jgi:hypothetical protein